MQQGRWVSYIFRYRNNVRCENAGFIKVQKIANRQSVDARIQIGIKLYKNSPCSCKAYLLHRDDSGVLADYLTEIRFLAKERDTILKREELPWSDPLGNGRSIQSYDGIIFVCDDGERLAGMWNEGDIRLTDIKINDYKEEKQVIAEDNSLGKLSEYGEAGQELIESKDEPINNSTKSNAEICREILETHKKLPLFADSQFIECVRIVPQDIGRLAMENWKLGVNSFLSHGYYHYRYLMLGRVKLDDAERTVIGVPGVFTNKEKYLANMFGFRVFVPAKKTEYLTGKFGYWISEVANV